MIQIQAPLGTVTLMFTDIEGSTRTWEEHPHEMQVALARHDALIRGAIEAANGFVFKAVGDGFCASFVTARDAVDAVLNAQLALMAESWPEEAAIRVRMALHTGAVESRDGDYFGPPVNRVSRLLSTAHGGQSIVSHTTFELVRDYVPEEVTFKDLGGHQLKDLARPEQVFQLLHPALPADFPALKSLSNHPNNLPQQLTTFIGREKEVEELQALLEKNRLVTLTGSGGTGKSRLGLQAAANTLERYPDGVWLVELAPTSDPGLVVSTVAETLGVKEAPGTTVQQALIEYLKPKHLLIVLDNCEHLINAAAKLVETLLRGCPDIQILASSREALGIAGEQTYRVPSLSLPDPNKAHTAASLSHFEAVRLFIDRAVLAKPDFEVTNENAPTVASLCFHLDGIPLAIELAAARVRSLSVDEIESKLDHRFRLLTGGSRTALPRQQTLRALIDWSYDLLNESEKALLNRLSVFAGGWTLEAAEPVCSGEPLEDWEVLTLLTSLCDKSLVVTDEQNEATRYRLLETVRQYAQDRLSESGEESTWRDRHLDYFLALAEEADKHLRGKDQKTWIRRVESEHDNIRVALDWSGSDPERSALEEVLLAAAMTQWWYVRGHFSEGRARLEHALSHQPEVDASVRSKVLSGVGNFALIQSLSDEAEQYFAEALQLTETQKDRTGILRAQRGLANVYWHRQDLDQAADLNERTLALAREEGDLDATAAILLSLGLIAVNRGHCDEGIALYEQSLAIFQELGNQRAAALVVGNLGGACYTLGDFEGTRKYFTESLESRRDLGDQWGISGALMHLAFAACELKDYDNAIALFEECGALLQKLGNPHVHAWCLHGLGKVALGQGDLAKARKYAADALHVWRESKAIVATLPSVELFALINLAEGSPSTAVHLLGYAEKAHEESKVPPYGWEKRLRDDAISPVRLCMGHGAFDRVWAEGRELTPEQAIALALGTADPQE